MGCPGHLLGGGGCQARRRRPPSCPGRSLGCLLGSPLFNLAKFSLARNRPSLGFDGSGTAPTTGQTGGRGRWPRNLHVVGPAPGPPPRPSATGTPRGRPPKPPDPHFCLGPETPEDFKELETASASSWPNASPSPSGGARDENEVGETSSHYIIITLHSSIYTPFATGSPGPPPPPPSPASCGATPPSASRTRPAPPAPRARRCRGRPP